MNSFYLFFWKVKLYYFCVDCCVEVSIIGWKMEALTEVVHCFIRKKKIGVAKKNCNGTVDNLSAGVSR